MKNLFTLIILTISLGLSGQSKIDYLKNNRYDLLFSNFEFPDDNFKVIGFGALHGSAKTYEAEKILIRKLKNRNLIDYYIPETNFSQAYYFQKYLDTGDEALLKELTLAFQTIVMQEGTIDTYNHWKNIKELNDSLPQNKKIKVIGFDVINEYQFPIRHIIELTEKIKTWNEKELLKSVLKDNKLSLLPGDSVTVNYLKNFITSYEQNKTNFSVQIYDVETFEHILNNLKISFQEEVDRDKVIYQNFNKLSKKYTLNNKHLFFKYGVFHLEKYRTWNYASFFTRLIENNNYLKHEVVTVIGYLTKSQVLWDKLYDDKGRYTNYTIEKGYGISDYWKEYYKGIRKLKRTKLSDITLYQISAKDSPYNKGTHLIELKMFFSDYNGKVLKGKNTVQFIDYAVLISNSSEQIPIEELKK